jgi:hypothetical protein
MDETPRRYLVLVIGTLAGPGPAAELLDLSRRAPSSFHFVVPATVPEYGWTWTEGQPLADGQERLAIMLEFGGAMGLRATGQVRETPDPVEIVRQVVGETPEPYDELIVIDRARGLRRWLEERALDELRRDPGLPITRFEADPPMRQGKDFNIEELRARFQEFLEGAVRNEERR